MTTQQINTISAVIENIIGLNKTVQWKIVGTILIIISFWIIRLIILKIIFSP